MFRRLLLLAGCAAILAAAGCRTENLGRRRQDAAQSKTEPQTGSAKISGTAVARFEIIGSDAEFDTQARILGEKMLEAMRLDDYPAFVSTLPADKAEMFPPAAFTGQKKGLVERYGKITGYEFLGMADTGMARQYLWYLKSELPAAFAVSAHPRKWTNLFYITVVKVNGKVRLDKFRVVCL